MKLTWKEIHKRFTGLRFEDNRTKGKPVGLRLIKEAIINDEDYLLEIVCPRGSIYRHDLEGEVWGVYVNSPGHKRRRSIWSKLDALGLEQVQCGDIEGCWKFLSKDLDNVATIMGMRKRRKR